MYPENLALTAWTRPSSSATTPLVSTPPAIVRFSTLAVVTPICCRRSSGIRTTERPAGSWPAAAEGASSAYLGTRSMSMKGDLPGWSKCTSGFIGSYQ